MKTFYSAEDIEDLAERGQHEVYIDDNMVLTDLAKQTANMLGIRITDKPPGAVAATRVPPAGNRRPPGSKPRGCQRRPAGRPASASGTQTGQSRQVVDKLVEKIKGIDGKSG